MHFGEFSNVYFKTKSIYYSRRSLKSGRYSFLIAKEEEVREKENLVKVARTIKAAKLLINSIDDKIITTSVCNLKPIYFLSASCKNIK